MHRNGKAIDNYVMSENSLQKLEKIYEKEKINRLKGKNKRVE